MALPDSYTLKPGSVTAYFEAMLDAEAPERFTVRFLESLEFKSINDRLWIGVLKELGFVDTGSRRIAITSSSTAHNPRKWSLRVWVKPTRVSLPSTRTPKIYLPRT